MATFGDLQDVVRYIRSLDDKFEAQTMKALLATSQMAKKYAVENSKREFIGRNGKTLGGTLSNNIISGLEDGDGRYPDIYAGTKTIPYGRIHEYGGEINPVKAKKLWIPQYAAAKKMTPREFMDKMRANPKMYHLFPGAAMKATGPINGPLGSKKSAQRGWIPLFFLVDQVKMPERPYIRPALKSAMSHFPLYMEKFLMGVTK